MLLQSWKQWKCYAVHRHKPDDEGARYKKWPEGYLALHCISAPISTQTSYPEVLQNLWERKQYAHTHDGTDHERKHDRVQSRSTPQKPPDTEREFGVAKTHPFAARYEPQSKEWKCAH